MGSLCPVLIPVTFWRHAVFVFEGRRKGFLIRKTAGVHNVTDVFVGEHQQFHGFVEALFDNMAVDRAAGFLFEQAAQMRIREMESRCQFIDRQIFVQILVDVFRYGGNQRQRGAASVLIRFRGRKVRIQKEKDLVQHAFQQKSPLICAIAFHNDKVSVQQAAQFIQLLSLQNCEASSIRQTEAFVVVIRYLGFDEGIWENERQSLRLVVIVPDGMDFIRIDDKDVAGIRFVDGPIDLEFTDLSGHRIAYFQ